MVSVAARVKTKKGRTIKLQKEHLVSNLTFPLISNVVIKREFNCSSWALFPQDEKWILELWLPPGSRLTLWFAVESLLWAWGGNKLLWGLQVKMVAWNPEYLSWCLREHSGGAIVHFSNGQFRKPISINSLQENLPWVAPYHPLSLKISLSSNSLFFHMHVITWLRSTITEILKKCKL